MWWTPIIQWSGGGSQTARVTQMHCIVIQLYDIIPFSDRTCMGRPIILHVRRICAMWYTHVLVLFANVEWVVSGTSLMIMRNVWKAFVCVWIAHRYFYVLWRRSECVWVSILCLGMSGQCGWMRVDCRRGRVSHIIQSELIFGGLFQWHKWPASCYVMLIIV